MREFIIAAAVIIFIIWLAWYALEGRKNRDDDDREW